MRLRILVALVLAVGSTAWAASGRRSGFVDLEATSTSSAALESLVAEQRFAEAFDRAIAELEESDRRWGATHPNTLLALHRVGVVAHLAGDQATADDVLGAVIDARRRVLPQGDPAIVESLLRRGRAARFRGDRARAHSLYDEADALLAARKEGHPALQAELLQLRADWMRGEDDAPSVDLYERALALRRIAAPEASFAIADNETWLAWTLAHARRRGEAQPYAEDALRRLEALGLSHHALRATLEEIVADRLTLEGRNAEAEARYRVAADVCVSLRRRQLGGYSRRVFPLDSFDALAIAALARGDGEKAWQLAETGRGATHVDFATLGAWPRLDPRGFKSWTYERRRLDDVRKRLIMSSGGAPAWNAATAPTFLVDLSLRAKIAHMSQRFLEIHRPAAPSLERVQRLLRPNDALVGWVERRLGGTPLDSVGPDRSESAAFVVRATGPVAWVPLWRHASPASDQVMRGAWGPLFAVLNRAAAWPTRVSEDPQIGEWMRSWSRWNLDPVLPSLRGVDHVVIERLIEPIDLAVLANGRLFGDVFDVSYAPSALTLSLLADDEPKGRSAKLGPVLAVAGPTDSSLDTRVDQLVGMADAPSAHRGGRSAYRRGETALSALPKLHYAALETRSIASEFDDATVLEGDRTATTIGRLAALDRLASYRVLHFATHTLTDGAPERCALALSEGAGDDPGVLEVEDIVLGWRLDADLITLSGCETLRAAGAARGEPYGFTPALFAAGAKRVLSSLWPVDDRATTILMSRFYENYTGRYQDRRLGATGVPMEASRALREARSYVRTLTDATGAHPYAHPVYWAGFFLLGLPH
ncbi:MAG TPA: CHAT domain-containing protein [Candidatus Polarisedimenticolaceae bacterium]|nr:CHAT domain-containing protein [Candidatus Polarisedimenticolaceae bacterium]